MPVTITWKKRFDIYTSKITYEANFEYEGADESLEQKRIKNVIATINNAYKNLKLEGGFILIFDPQESEEDERRLWLVDWLFREGKPNEEKNNFENYAKLEKKSKKYKDIAIRVESDGKNMPPLQWQIVKRKLRSNLYVHKFNTQKRCLEYDVFKNAVQKQLTVQGIPHKYDETAETLIVKEVVSARRINGLFGMIPLPEDQKTHEVEVESQEAQSERPKERHSGRYSLPLGRGHFTFSDRVKEATHDLDIKEDDDDDDNAAHEHSYSLSRSISSVLSLSRRGKPGDSSSDEEDYVARTKRKAKRIGSQKQIPSSSPPSADISNPTGSLRSANRPTSSPLSLSTSPASMHSFLSASSSSGGMSSSSPSSPKSMHSSSSLLLSSFSSEGRYSLINLTQRGSFLAHQETSIISVIPGSHDKTGKSPQSGSRPVSPSIRPTSPKNRN